MCGVQRLICKHNQLSEPIQAGNFFAETSINISRKACSVAFVLYLKTIPSRDLRKIKTAVKKMCLYLSVRVLSIGTAYQFRSDVTVLLAVSKNKGVPVQAIKTWGSAENISTHF